MPGRDPGEGVSLSSSANFRLNEAADLDSEILEALY